MESRSGQARHGKSKAALLAALSRALGCGTFRKLGVPYFGVLIIRILLFRVLC